MNQKAVIAITVAAYIVLMAVVSAVSAKKVTRASDLTVGGRNAGAWLSALSYGTAYFSAVMFVGYAGATGWNFNLYGVLAGLGNAVFGSYLAWKLLARRTRDVSYRLKIKSMPQFFELRYGSKGLRTLSSVIMFIFLIPYSASVYKGLASVCNVVLDIPEMTCMIIIAAVAALLLVFGGYMAQVRADFVQGIIMMFGVALMIFFVIRCDAVGGARGIAEFAENGGLPSLSSSQWVSLMATVLMTSFGTWGLPQMVQKYFGIKNDDQAKKGIIISTFFALLVSGGGYFIGSLGHMFFDKMPEGGQDYIVPNMLKSASLPSVLLGVILVLLISASVSTLASISLTAGSIFSLDIIKEKFDKSISDKKLKILIKAVCFLFVVCSFVVANTDTPILDMMSYSWGIISGSFMAAYLLPLYCKKINRIGAFASVASGFAIAVVPAFSKCVLLAAGSPQNAEGTLKIFSDLASKGPLFACIAMAVSLVVCFAVSLLTPQNLEKCDTDYFYNGCVDRSHDNEVKA